MPESSGSSPASAPRLSVDVERQLPEFRLAVRLQVGTEICVLFGPSGVGKTTTLNIIAGLLAPDAGEILLDGRPLFRRGRPGTACNVPARHRNIGYVFQGYALFPHLNALENVAYPLRGQRDARSRAAALLERMHLAHLADRYPAELSGGQQQRVAIARRWPPIRRSCCWMSRSRRWTRGCVNICSVTWQPCRPSCGWP